MERRRFLKTLLAFLGSTTLVSFAYPLLRYLAPPDKKTEAKKLTIQKAEIPPGIAKDVVIGEVPAVVINLRGKGYTAFSRICTHLGCLVEYDSIGKRFVCPCHAGSYDTEGNVISGPPPRPLSRIPVKAEGENIVIG